MKTPLSRRTFLHAGAASVALPLLDAMSPVGLRAETKGPQPPKRMVLLHRGLGTYHPLLTPKNTGKDYVATRYLKPLERHRQNFTLFSGMSHLGYPNSHTTSAAIFTGVGPNGVKRGDDIHNTISLDQRVATEIGGETRVRSLTLNSSNGAASLSWNNKGIPVPTTRGRAEVFRRLFIEGTATEVARELDRLAHGRSILDDMRDQLKSLARDLGATDRERLDVMQTSIREAEQLLHQEEAWAEKPKPDIDAKESEFSGKDSSWVHGDNRWYQLIRLALQTDSTRVIVFGIGEHNPTGVPGLEIGHHDASHHGKNPEKIEQLARYEMKDYENFAGFLDLLDETKEAGGSLLDHTQVLLASNLGDASAHASNNLPIFLAGGGFKHEGHTMFDEENNLPLSNLYARMLQKFGIETDSFGSSTGVLSEFG
ncbi:DUF1552 domain-containing protein [bacterium]|nr:DUF1552 domain-containing protein [bacterium]